MSNLIIVNYVTVLHQMIFMLLTLLKFVTFPRSKAKPCITANPAITAFVVAIAGIMLPAMAIMQNLLVKNL